MPSEAQRWPHLSEEERSKRWWRIINDHPELTPDDSELPDGPRNSLGPGMHKLSSSYRLWRWRDGLIRHMWNNANDLNAPVELRQLELAIIHRETVPPPDRIWSKSGTCFTREDCGNPTKSDVAKTHPAITAYTAPGPHNGKFHVPTTYDTTEALLDYRDAVLKPLIAAEPADPHWLKYLHCVEVALAYRSHVPVHLHSWQHLEFTTTADEIMVTAGQRTPYPRFFRSFQVIMPAYTDPLLLIEAQKLWSLSDWYYETIDYDFETDRAIIVHAATGICTIVSLHKPLRYSPEGYADVCTMPDWESRISLPKEEEIAEYNRTKLIALAASFGVPKVEGLGEGSYYIPRSENGASITAQAAPPFILSKVLFKGERRYVLNV